MKLQRLLSLTRQAIEDYEMIQPGDTIALGLSGGKDSLTLLYALHQLQKFYPASFKLCAITVDLGFDQFDVTPLKKLCQQLSIPYQVIPSDIGKILFDIRKETNPCSLCAKLRKGVLNQAALDFGCNKIAYAHHKDDLIETMLLSLFYEGRFHAFSPKSYLDRTNLTLIRPMLYVEENEVIKFKNKYQLPICKNPCPVDGHTKREYVKNLARSLSAQNPGSKDCMYHAIINGGFSDWPLKTERKR